MPFRIGVVGARRRRQGTGEHVARHLHALGAEVACIAGTSRETAETARRQLAERYGLGVSAYADIGEMLAEQRLDAVAICSPREFHLEHLRLALEHGLHVLCEKPLVFGQGRDPAAEGRRILDAFSAAGALLMVNEQWPYTLPAFAQLYPAVLGGRPPRRLRVLLSPAVDGAEMVPNSLPHAFSLLLSLAAPGGAMEGISIEPLQREQDAVTAMRIAFRYVHSAGSTDVTVVLRRTLGQPRPLGYEIDGHALERVIELPGYRQFFQTAPSLDDGSHVAPGKRVPLEDPLRLLLADFLHRSGRGDCRPDGRIVDSLAMLRDVYAAAVSQIHCNEFPRRPMSLRTATSTEGITPP